MSNNLGNGSYLFVKIKKEKYLCVVKIHIYMAEMR